MIRKAIFWVHLSCGVSAGLVILMMSATGVLLTYERQMLAWADAALYAAPQPGARRVPVEDIVAAVESETPGFAATSVIFRPDPAAPVGVAAGRGAPHYVNPYTGAVLDDAAPRLRGFFTAVTGWHRYFNATGDSRAPWRAITGACNLAFLFLVLSGMYLWLPKIYRWMAFKTRLMFNPEATSSKARDYNWHHVFGIWSAVPLVFVVASAVIFSYGWADALLFRSFGDPPPSAAPTPVAPAPSASAAKLVSAADPRSLDDLVAVAGSAVGDWQTLALQLPPEGAAEVRFALDGGNGGQPQFRHALVLDAYTGAVIDSQPFASQTAGRRARTIVRYLHTGEVLGIAGQTIAGIVSLTSLIMVWTGLALAYRRLVLPVLSGSR